MTTPKMNIKETQRKSLSIMINFKKSEGKSYPEYESIEILNKNWKKKKSVEKIKENHRVK